MKSKILTSAFYKAHGTGANLTYYHNITVEGQSKTLNIGAKQQNPPWLQPGQELEWEWKDESKGSIKKAQKPFGQAPAAADPSELRVSTGLIVAAILYTGGKIDKHQVDETAVRIANKFEAIKASL